MWCPFVIFLTADDTPPGCELDPVAPPIRDIYASVLNGGLHQFLRIINTLDFSSGGL